LVFKYYLNTEEGGSNWKVFKYLPISICCNTDNCPVVACGDFNVHVDQVEDTNAVRLDQLLQSFGYVQHVSEPTHNAGHTIDLVITRSDVVVTSHQLVRRLHDI